MKSNLATIENVLDRELDHRHENAESSLTGSDLRQASAAAKRVVAGFELHDDKLERANLDNLIASRRAAITRFRTDRHNVRDHLAVHGVTPLAVVPLVAWNSICDAAKLFRLAPDAYGRVGISANAFRNYIVETLETKRGMFGNTFVAARYTMKEAAAAGIDWDAVKDWPAFLLGLLGGFASPTLPTGFATLVLPVPPADVAAILLKCAGLPLKVAAVAEAISFKETPSELLRREVARREAEARRREAIMADPIVYVEHETAVAVIAQFGDFPIEQEVVDAVVRSNDLVGDNPGPLHAAQYQDINEMYRQTVGAMNRNAFDWPERERQAEVWRLMTESRGVVR